MFHFSAVFAGGYQVSLHNQRNIGMGLIGTSLIDDASSAFYNPGALAKIPSDYSFLAGVSGIRSITKFQLESPSIYQAATDNPIGFPFYFYAAARINPSVSFGLAINTPYGNRLKWEEGWAGRFIIQEISLQAVTVQPSISYKINEMISIGAGLVVAMGSVDLKRKLPVQDDSGEGKVNINGSTVNYGFNAGILITPLENFNVGLSYRSLINMKVDDAKARFSVPASLANNFPENNTVATSLPLPANLDFGISYSFSENITAGISLNYVFWDAYKSLDFDFETNTAVVTDTQNPREYKNRLIFRLGAEYKVIENVFLRVGSYYDPSPVNEKYFSPETPGLNNLGITTGMSFFPLPELSIDLSFVYITGFKKEAIYTPDNFGGTYKSRAYIPGIGVSYNF